MIQYKNISYSAKTFYGVEFAPGEVKSVPGYINSPSMVRVFGKQKSKPAPAKIQLFDDPAQGSHRGRKKKSNEPEKVSVAETDTTIISEEETSNGNPS